MDVNEKYEMDAIEQGAWQRYLDHCNKGHYTPVSNWTVLTSAEQRAWIDYFIARFPKLQYTHTLEAEPYALDVQVDGSHYKSMRIQPVEFAHANNLPFIEGSIVKYVCRHRNKNGVKDLEKAKHFIDLLIELEYSDNDSTNSEATDLRDRDNTQAGDGGQVRHPDTKLVEETVGETAPDSADLLNRAGG